VPWATLAWPQSSHSIDDLKLLNEGVAGFCTSSTEIIDIAGYNCQAMYQSDGCYLFVYWMFMTRRHQAAPYLSAFIIEAQYPISVARDNQVKPNFQLPGLGKIATMPDILQPSSNLTDGLHGQIEFFSFDCLEKP
jgi:hypothetical protein